MPNSKFKPHSVWRAVTGTGHLDFKFEFSELELGKRKIKDVFVSQVLRTSLSISTHKVGLVFSLLDAL